MLTTTTFDKKVLQQAIKETLQNRGTKFPSTILDNKEYINSSTTERMWTNMKRKRQIKEVLSFTECATYIREYLSAIIDELGGQ